MACAILLPAAGASQRMCGRDKLLEPVAGQPVLRVMAQRACAASPWVAVALRPDDPARCKTVADLDLSLLEVPDAAEGMAAALRASAHWAMSQPVEAMMIALPDMPEITAGDMRALIAAQARDPERPLRACDAAQRMGHPVVLPRALFPAMQRLCGDMGARSLLQAHPPRLHPLPGSRALRDLDTPEDWAEWRRRSC